MGRFIFWLLTVITSLAVGAMLPAATRAMAKSAASAYQNDQMSYLKFSKELTSPRNRHQ
jgi:hypothetical protein